MAAPLGNQFWKLAPTTGRKPLYESAETLLADCLDYLQITSERIIEQHDFVGKDATDVTRKHKPPFTLSGLCVFLGMSQDTWRNYRLRKDFIEVLRAIEEIIYTQKFEGAAVGIYQQNIIARDLGLVDKKDVTNTERQPIKIESSNPEEEALNKETLNDLKE